MVPAFTDVQFAGVFPYKNAAYPMIKLHFFQDNKDETVNSIFGSSNRFCGEFFMEGHCIKYLPSVQ